MSDKQTRRRESFTKEYNKAKNQCQYLILSAILSFFIVPFIMEYFPWAQLNIGTFLGIDLDPIFWWLLIGFILFMIFRIKKAKKNRKIKKAVKRSNR